LIVPALLSISLMNFKETRLIADEPTPQVAQTYLNRYKLPMVKRSSLDIERVKKILQEQGKEAEVGIQQALLNCQHLMLEPTSTEVFAHHNGTFWWDNESRTKPEAKITAIRNEQIKAVSTPDEVEKKEQNDAENNQQNDDQSVGTNG
jgi:hypothetical protein